MEKLNNELTCHTLGMLNILELVAKYKSDGHFTIMKFTTGWKCMFGTPDLDSGEGRNMVSQMPLHKTLSSAITDRLYRAVMEEIE